MASGYRMNLIYADLSSLNVGDNPGNEITSTV